MMAKDRKGKTGVGITFEELRRAKYDFALGDDARICKHLNDLLRLLRAHRLPEADKTGDALTLIAGPIMKIAGARRKSLRRVMEFVAAEIGRGRAESAREVVDDMIGGIFRHSPEGIECWGGYRKRFERLFPEVIRYRDPLLIKLQDYNTLVVTFLRKGVEGYRLEMEHEDYEKARVVFVAGVGGRWSVAGGQGRWNVSTLARSSVRGQWAGVWGEGAGESVEARLEWWTLRASTLTMLEHKSIGIELPARGDCRVEFLGRPGVECRLDYSPAAEQGAALYVADRKGRLVRVFCDRAHEP